jgi:hypothetical protein
VGNCGGFGYQAPSSGVGGGGGAVAVVPRPSTRAKTPAELACNAKGGLFFTAPNGGSTATWCQTPSPTDNQTFHMSSCGGYTVFLGGNGKGDLTFEFPNNILYGKISFLLGVQFNIDCSFNVYG